MEISPNTRLMNILADPEFKHVLEWYGLPTNDRSHFRLTLAQFCDLHDVDLGDVLVELEAVSIEDDWESDGYEDEEDWASM